MRIIVYDKDNKPIIIAEDFHDFLSQLRNTDSHDIQYWDMRDGYCESGNCKCNSCNNMMIEDFDLDELLAELAERELNTTRFTEYWSH